MDRDRDNKDVIEQALDLIEWLRKQDERILTGLRTVGDAEELYNHWQEHLLDLDCSSTSCDGLGFPMSTHRTYALGYDPLFD